MTPGGERSRVGGRTCRSRPGGKGLGGYGLGGLVWVWAGLAWARYFALSLPTAAAAAAAGEASAARAGFFPRLARRARGRSPSRALRTLLRCRGGRRRGARGRGRRLSHILLGLLCCRGGRLRGAHGPCGVRRNPSCALLALLRGCGSPRRRVRLLRRGCPLAGGVPGAAAGAAAWLAAVSASCASGRGGAAGLAAWAAGAAVSAGPGSRAGGGGPTTAASASLRSSRSARVSPVHSGEETGERERDRRWWRSSRPRDPSESAITVTLVGMRGGRRALPTTSWCISAVPWAVPCGALRGGGGGRRGWGAGCGVSPARPGVRGHPPALGGRRGSHAAHASRHSSQSGAGLRALGPRGSSSGAGGSRTRWTPVTAVTSCVRRKVCTPSRAAGAGRGGGYRCGPIEVGGGDPQDPPRVPAGRDDEEEQGVPGHSCQRTCPLWWAPLVPGEGGGQVWVSPAAGRVRRRWEGGAPSGLPGERLVDDGVRGGRPGAVIHRVGRPGAGGRLVRAFHEHRDLAHLQVLVRRV